jgi:two-component system OmpR family sensor kinase
MTSVRRTLIATLLAAVTAVTAAAGAMAYRLTRREIDAVFDYHLRQLALSLRDRALGRRVAAPPPSPDFEFVIQVWDVDGTKLYASGVDTGLPEVAQLGLDTVRTPAGAWRVYSADLAGEVIQVAQPLAVRQRLALAAALRALAPIALALPLLSLLVWRIVGRSLAPLDRLAGAVGARSPAALDPIAEAGAPEEALPLVRALNGLLHRLATALSVQRAFVADAAHELRTPLTALQLQAQLVERARDEGERGAAVVDLRRGLQRAAHLVQQLLALAREEPGVARPAAAAPVRLADAAAEVVADHAVVAEAKGIDLGAARSDDAAIVRGEAGAIRTLIANLVENAVQWTPAGGRIDVTAAVAEGRPYLEVADTGPGIPAAERGRVLDRFYRRSGGPGTGAGLGLAIVKAIADRHGADLRLGDTPGGGLTVRATFPARDGGP